MTKLNSVLAINSLYASEVHITLFSYIYLFYDAIFIWHLLGKDEVRLTEEQCYNDFVSQYIWQEIRIANTRI